MRFPHINLQENGTRTPFVRILIHELAMNSLKRETKAAYGGVRVPSNI